MKKIGKKTRQWFKDRKNLIKEAVASGRIQLNGASLMGLCAECKKYLPLDLDHKIKRSRGGDNSKANVQLICRKCHDRLDNMPDSKKNNSKAVWQKKHECKNCKRETMMLLCEHCGKLSVKT